MDIHLLYIVVRVISKIILVQSLTATTFGLPVIIMNLFYQVNPIMISGSTADMVVCLEFGTGWILIDLPRIEVLTIYESTKKIGIKSVEVCQHHCQQTSKAFN